MIRKASVMIFFLVLLTSCGDDDPTGPGNGLTAMDRIWPHVDGADWIYDLECTVFADPEIEDPVPPLPTMEELHQALTQPVPQDPVSRETGLYRLKFDGTVTTQSGVTAQDLVETVYEPVGGEPLVSRAPGNPTDPFLRTLYRARPDLRAAIERQLGESVFDLDKSLADVNFLYFLGAYAFAAEDSGYYGYGDVSTHHAWTYLEGDLEVGSSFSLQLVPELADDIWLYGQIWSVEDREIGGVEWTDVVECLYLVDMGIAERVDENGQPLGQTRAYMAGITMFAPDRGPVSCLERRGLVADPDVFGSGEGGIFEFRCEIAP